jgi:Subtilase family
MLARYRVLLCLCLTIAVPLLSASAEDAGRVHALAPADSFIFHQRAEHLALLGANHWQAAGYRGQRIKIAVLDLGFRGYRAHLGNTLPTQVKIQCFRSDGNFEAKNSQHGILCAEVLHAIAPEAELLLATWDPDDSSRFLEAVRWARREGARIISCSVITPGWSDGQGGGSFHRDLARVLGKGDVPGDMLYFASSGNTALRHWSGIFHAGTDGFHEWLPGQTSNPLGPWGSGRVSVELYGPTGSQYEVCVWDTTAGCEVSHSPPEARASAFDSTFSTAVRFLPRLGAVYQVRVRLLRGQPGLFHLVVLGGGLSWATAEGSVPCPADGPEVIAVGAVSRDGRRPSYSSCGSSSPILKPDLVAPVPFPSLCRAGAFSGTSAAAPQAAGLAALIWSRHPEWTGQQVHDTLVHSAQDLGPRGPDSETGYGMVRVPTSLRW